jgi:hypothetical protein
MKFLYSFDELETTLYQVLSNSVADALEYCHAKVPGWEEIDISGTCKFLRIINILFDRMNSKSPFGKFLNSPLGSLNKDEIFNDFVAGESYILSLGMQPLTSSAATDEPQNKKIKSDMLVVSGPRKKGFIGFLVNMITYKKLYEIYIHTGHLKYLLTYKTSQDHVEHLFCSIRGSLGKNSNPTTKEFTTSLKKILLGATHHSQFSNCLFRTTVQLFPFLLVWKKHLLPTKLVQTLEKIARLRNTLNPFPLFQSTSQTSLST